MFFFKKYDIIEKVTDTLVAIKPKTDKSIRKAVVVDEVYNLFMEYKQYQIDNGFNPTDEDYVFRTVELNNVLQPNYLTKEWTSFVKTNNLKPITVHDIRHSHATYLLAIGIPLQDVARRLGHSEVSTTLKIYTHSNLIQDQKIANVMERYIYNNNDAPNVGIQPLTLLSILTKNPKITNENDLFDTLEWLSNDNITYDDLDTYMNICKQYILDSNPNLQIFNQFIESVNPEIINKLLDGIYNIFDNNHELLFNPISDISKYKDEYISI